MTRAEVLLAVVNNRQFVLSRKKIVPAVCCYTTGYLHRKPDDAL